MTQTTMTLPLRRPVLAGLIGLVATATALRKQRASLANLDDTRLADLGLSRAEAEREAARPVWDVPAFWRR